MVNGSDLSAFGHLRRFNIRVFSFGSSIFVGSKNSSPSLYRFFGAGSLLSFLFLLAASCAYLYLHPDSQPLFSGSAAVGDSPSSSVPIVECNITVGKWAKDASYYPLYNASDCPFVEHGFDCLANGRKDGGYLKWRWRPKNCEIPRFNAQTLLEYFRGKRVVFVGDSLSRTQWESLICMLMSGVEDKKTVYEVNGNQITKQIRFLGVRFSSHNFTIEFYRSVFLVLYGPPPRRAPKRVQSTLSLDQMDDGCKEWIGADVLIFNTGHWWTKTKLFEMGTYFQMGRSLKLGMPIAVALKLALDTWASWVDSVVNPNKTRVFFRTFESSHWSDGTRNKCKVSPHPMPRTKGRERSPISDTIMKVVRNMSVPVMPLPVTSMGAYRSDAHVGRWSDNPSVPDCSHWCLPGLPDTWNEVLFSYLLEKDVVSP
ncbi:Protein trichome berefringence-like 7 [Dionaea muscipula]